MFDLSGSVVLTKGETETEVSYIVVGRGAVY